MVMFRNMPFKVGEMHPLGISGMENIPVQWCERISGPLQQLCLEFQLPLKNKIKGKLPFLKLSFKKERFRPKSTQEKTMDFYYEKPNIFSSFLCH